jgi:dihydroorotate dehydrogenase
LFNLAKVLARRFLYALDPETAHVLAIQALRLAVGPSKQNDERLRTRAFGLTFPNPIGTAAGLDKNAGVIDPLLRLGFGFVEIGSVTPRPHSGSPRPRLFRLDADKAVVNRLGFNNEGHALVRSRLAARDGTRGIVGVNIGANRDSVDRLADYVAGIEALAEFATYITINISSPNTPGLRDLQQAAVLQTLLARVLEARDGVANGRHLPILLKIAPDLSLSELDDIIAVARRNGIDGMIVSNTTVTRPPSLKDKAGREVGGLSGRPLAALSTRVLAETFVRVEGAFPLIGVGGIDSGEAALSRMRAGATLIQIYTGLVFRGTGLVDEIKERLVRELALKPSASTTEVVGIDAAAVTREPWPR